jgi:AcrR family transcriptional regulator
MSGRLEPPPRPVQDGVFFTAPRDLPRGRHDLTREAVQEVHRERLMIAVTELVAHQGYRAVGVRQIARQAKVSLAVFYECFADKDDCFYAAYARFIDVLVSRLTVVVEDAVDRHLTAELVVHEYLAALEADRVVAQAFLVEMDALGRSARDRRRAALGGIVEVLKSQHDERWPDAEPVPFTAYIGMVYAVRQIVSDAIDTQHDEPLTDLTAELSRWAGASLVSLHSAH